MNGKDIFLGLQYLDEKWIDQAEFGSFSQKAFQEKTELEVPMKRNRISRVFLLAAVIALLTLLVGCGIVYMLKMQDLKIGETEIATATRAGSHGQQGSETQAYQILTFSGVKGSVNYQAAKEYLEFEKSFDPDGNILMAARKQPSYFPAEFDAYNIYSQEQADKLLDIAQTNGLQLAGPEVHARTPRSLLSYLNMEDLLLPDTTASLSNLEAAYHENGLFYADFYLLMEQGGSAWPHDALCLYYYTPKTCLSPHFAYLSEPGDWREWNYTTASGESVLMLRSDTAGEAYIFRDQETATSVVKICTNELEESMTDRQLQQMADQINFSLTPQPGDPAILEGFGSGIDASARTQMQNGFIISLKSVKTDGEIAYVTLGVTAPEGTNLDEMGIHPGNRGEGLMLPKEELLLPNLNVNWNSQEDGDGQENTQDLVVTADSGTMNGSGFDPDSIWSLYIEGLDLSDPHTMLQSGIQQQIDGVWQFDISFEEGDFQELECIQEPVSVSVWGASGKEETCLVSLTLRAYSASAEFENMSGSLDDYENDTCTTAVLKDGSTIHLYHTGGPGLVTRLQPEREIPLDQVDYVLLTDGTRLTPRLPA